VVPLCLQLPQITEGPPESGRRHLAADCKADTSIRHLRPIRDSPDTQFRPVNMVEGAPAHGAVAHLLPLTYKRYVSEWLEEDTPSFDYVSSLAKKCLRLSCWERAQ
jgi:hypothetical protein